MLEDGAARAVGRALVVSAALGIAVPLALSVAQLETAIGLACGVGLLLLVCAPALAVQRAAWARRAGRGCALAGLAALALVIARAPAGHGDAASGLTSRFLPGHEYARWSPANLLPELDQLALEHTVLRPLIQRTFGDVYIGCMTYQLPVQREIHARPEWRELGSSGMHEGWADVVARLRGEAPPAPSHWYQYVPPHRAGERLPVIVFFHGFGCNAKTDLWCWKPIADRLHCALIHPSMGFGMLDTARATALEPFLPVWRADPDLDWTRAYVGGLSNGAVRAALAAADRPGLWRGVILLSPVYQAVAACGMPVWHNDRPLDPSAYPPVLAIMGGQDPLLSAPWLEERRTQLAQRGVSLTTTVYADMDHYVNFRARDRYEKDVEDWVAAVESGRIKRGR